MKIPKKGTNVPRRIREKLDGDWQIVARAPFGHVFEDRMIGMLRFLITRGPIALCAYIGIPLGHPLSGRKYDELEIPCHGGLTFSEAGDGGIWPADRWWYGWDYGHFQDRTIYSSPELAYRAWTPAMVAEDAEEALREFDHLVKNE